MTSRNLGLARCPATHIPAEPTVETCDALERARKRLGWSQLRAALELKASPRSFCAWEAGEAEPKLSWLRRHPQFFSAVMRELGFEPVAVASSEAA